MKTRTGKRSRGFTLIEMMVVIVIILILSGIVLKVATLAGRKGASSRAEAQLQQLANALSAYNAEYGRYPPGTGDPAENTQYEYECAPSQTPWFRKTYLPQHNDPDKPGDFFPDIIPSKSKRAGWPYDGIPQAHRDWGLGYRYGLIAHLWLRANPLKLTLAGIPGIDQTGMDPKMGMQLHWYDEDTDRDIAAKKRWAVMLEGIGLDGSSWSPEHSAPASAAPAQWINCLARIPDPWLRDYRYICLPPYLSYDLWSVGPDGANGTGDDVHVRN